MNLRAGTAPQLCAFSEAKNPNRHWNSIAERPLAGMNWLATSTYFQHLRKLVLSASSTAFM